MDQPKIEWHAKLVYVPSTTPFSIFWLRSVLCFSAPRTWRPINCHKRFRSWRRPIRAVRRQPLFSSQLISSIDQEVDFLDVGRHFTGTELGPMYWGFLHLQRSTPPDYGMRLMPKFKLFFTVLTNFQKAIRTRLLQHSRQSFLLWILIRTGPDSHDSSHALICPYFLPKPLLCQLRATCDRTLVVTSKGPVVCGIWMFGASCPGRRYCRIYGDGNRVPIWTWNIPH